MADERTPPPGDTEESGGQPMDRRRFLTVMGVSGAGAAVLSGCSTDKVEKLIPYLVQAEDQVPASPRSTPAPARSAARAAGCTS